MDIVCIDCHLIRVNVVKFHLAVASFAACDITSVIHSVLVLLESSSCHLSILFPFCVTYEISINDQGLR